MVVAGALEGVDAAFGIHVMPSIPSGHIVGALLRTGYPSVMPTSSCCAVIVQHICRSLQAAASGQQPGAVVRTGKPGTIMAAADLFDARIIGRGGHAAKPHLNVDAVLAASAIVMALQV